MSTDLMAGLMALMHIVAGWIVTLVVSGILVEIALHIPAVVRFIDSWPYALEDNDGD